MYRPITRCRQRRFLEGFCVGRVGVAHAGGVFGRGAEFHEGDGFGDQIGSAGADEVNAQYFVRFGVSQYFGHTVDIHTGP